jgi:hypothetical protein
MNWYLDYPINKFKPPKDYKPEAADTDKNQVVEREQLKDCEYLSKLIASFKKEYVWLEVNSVLLIWKQKEGTGFQNWHIDLVVKNSQTVYTICVYIGSLDIQADSGEINYLNADNNAHTPDIDDDEEEAREAYVGDSKGEEKQASLGDKVCVAKQASVACSLEFSDNEAYVDTIKDDSDNKFWSSFPRDRNSRNFILGGPQKPQDLKSAHVDFQRRKRSPVNTWWLYLSWGEFMD